MGRRVNKERLKIALDMLKNGKSYAQIGSALKITRQAAFEFILYHKKSKIINQ